MSKTICVINAHPDPSPDRFIAAICVAYVTGAREAGHTVSEIKVGELNFEFLSSAEAFATPPPEPILSERAKIKAADHVVLAFPLWLGSLPAKARAFFEQAARASFFLGEETDAEAWPHRMMQGKSARIFVTMGMPGIVYKTMMDAGALKAIERGMLGLSGFKPVRHRILGGVEAVSAEKRQSWLNEIYQLGQTAA